MMSGWHAADPGPWFDVLWVAHWIGIVVATWSLCWLSWRSFAPRWVVIVMILTTIAGLAIVAPATINAPGLLVFRAVALWRLRSAHTPDPASATAYAPRRVPTADAGSGVNGRGIPAVRQQLC